MEKIVRPAAVLALLGILALPQISAAQYSQDFEGLNGSAAGVILTGQDGYYLPGGVTNTDFKCYTYAGNALGVVQNPDGGAQFIGGTGPGDGVTYARAERSVVFGAVRMELLYDFCGIYIGAPPGSNNLGSFSMRQASANTVHINLFTWVDPNNPTAINSTYVAYDANGTQFPIPGSSPGAEWENLSPNHWYRCRTVIDLVENTIVEVGIRDLSGGNEAVFNPTGWYLIGGASGFLPPDGIRFFGGGGTPGNSTCWDNAIVREEIVGEGACCLPDGTCVITTQADCQGQYMGDGTSCSPDPCEPTAVKPSSWGAIKNEYR
jgi:hypothetical protein